MDTGSPLWSDCIVLCLGLAFAYLLVNLLMAMIFSV